MKAQPRMALAPVAKGSYVPCELGCRAIILGPRAPLSCHSPAWSRAEGDQGGQGLSGHRQAHWTRWGKTVRQVWPHPAVAGWGVVLGAHIRARALYTLTICFSTVTLSGLPSSWGGAPSSTSSRYTWRYFSIVWIRLCNTLCPKLFPQLGRQLILNSQGRDGFQSIQGVLTTPRGREANAGHPRQHHRGNAGTPTSQGLRSAPRVRPAVPGTGL